ncbi:MAG: glycosyltransferase [Myxococcota bacterium]
MRIVDVAEFYADRGGGVKTYVDHKLKAAAESGHEAIVLAPGPVDGEEARHGGRVVWLRSPPVPGDSRYHLFTDERRVHRALNRLDPDIVEGSSVYGGGWFAGRWKGRAKKVLVFHQDPVAVFGHALMDRWVPQAIIDSAFTPVWAALKSLSRRYDATVVAGHWLEARLRQRGIQNATAVPFGIDPEPFLAARRNPELRRQMLEEAGVPSSGFLLVTVSRHHPEKRLPTLIRAFGRIRAAFPAGLVIFGDGPWRRQVERHAAQVPGVVLKGFTSDRFALAEAVASADVLLHGSSAETYGLVVAEALCAGIPVIVPDAGGAAELADPDVCEKYRAGDTATCTAAIKRMLSRDIAELHSRCLGRRNVVRTLRQHFNDLFEFYSGLLGSSSKSSVAP